MKNPAVLRYFTVLHVPAVKVYTFKVLKVKVLIMQNNVHYSIIKILYIDIDIYKIITSSVGHFNVTAAKCGADFNSLAAYTVQLIRFCKVTSNSCQANGEKNIKEHQHVLKLTT